MARADKPIESSDDLSPITVKANEPADDSDDVDDAAEPSEPTPLGSAEAHGAPTQGDPATPKAPRLRPDGKPYNPRPPGAFGKPNHFAKNKELQELKTGYEKTIAELRQSMAQMQGRWDAMEQMRGGQQPQDPNADQLQQIADQMQQLELMAANPEITAEQRAGLGKQYRSLQDKRDEIRITAIAQKIASQQLQKFQQEMPSDGETRARGILADEFPRLLQDDRARQEASAYYNYLSAKAGYESFDIFREACQYVYTQRGWPSQGFRLSGRERGMYETAPASGRTSNGQNQGAITFNADDLRVMRGSGESPEAVAAEMRRMMRGGG